MSICTNIKKSTPQLNKIKYQKLIQINLKTIPIIPTRNFLPMDLKLSLSLSSFMEIPDRRSIVYISVAADANAFVAADAYGDPSLVKDRVCVCKHQ